MKKIYENKAAARRAHYYRYHDKHLARSKLWRETNPEKMKLNNRIAHLKRFYNMTLQEYDELLELQEGLCDICGVTLEDNRSTHIDHCHTTGKARGILCANCNKGLAFFDDNVLTLANSISYLEKHQKSDTLP